MVAALTFRKTYIISVVHVRSGIFKILIAVDLFSYAAAFSHLVPRMQNDLRALRNSSQNFRLKCIPMSDLDVTRPRVPVLDHKSTPAGSAPE